MLALCLGLKDKWSVMLKPKTLKVSKLQDLGGFPGFARESSAFGGPYTTRGSGLGFRV